VNCDHNIYNAPDYIALLIIACETARFDRRIAGSSRVGSAIDTEIDVVSVNDSNSSLVEQSMNVTSATKQVSTSKSVQSVQTKSVMESSTSVKSVTSSSTRSQQSVEYEETVEYSD